MTPPLQTQANGETLIAKTLTLEVALGTEKRGNATSRYCLFTIHVNIRAFAYQLLEFTPASAGLQPSGLKPLFHADHNPILIRTSRFV